jgi:glycosyltransferase involved in cell wall biosynthesis
MLSHLYPRPGDPGVVPFLRRQVAELRAKGVEFTVISPVPWAPRVPAWSRRLRTALRESRATPRSWVVDGIPVSAPRYPKLPGALDAGLYGPLYYLALRSEVGRLLRSTPFDLIHGQMLVPDGYAAARLGRRFGLPSVATERGYLSVLASRSSQRRAIRWTVENCDQCVFVAGALASIAATFGKPPRPFRVVYTGVDLDRFDRIDRQGARRALSLPAGGRLLLHLGRNDPRKGVAELLEIFAELRAAEPALMLAYVGQGSEDDHLRRRAVELGIADSVRVVGARPPEDVATWLAACDLVVHPSRKAAEGLPNALVEAGAASRAVVASRTAGIPEVIEDGETGLLVEPEGRGELKSAIAALISDEARRTAMGVAARRLVESRFSWSRHADEMLDIYESVVRRSGRPG